MAIGVPLAGAPPAILDITTSTVAEGKLMVALNKGVQVPEGWIVDKAGHPTTEPGTSTMAERSSPSARTRDRACRSSPTCSRAR